MLKMDVISTTSTFNMTKEPKIWESTVPPVLQFVLGVIGNLIALIALVGARKRHKWRPFHRLVAGLALTDGGGVLLVYPTVMIRYASDFTYEFPKPLCDYSSFIFTFMLISSAMIVCAMSFDRFIAILYPFKYNVLGKKHRANIMLISIWIFGAFISSLHLMGLGSSFNYYPGSWCFLNFVGVTILDRVNSYVYSLFGLLILFTTISFNVLVIMSLCRHFKEDTTISKTKRRKTDIFNVILLLVIVTLFTVCWTPLMFTILGHAALWISGNGSRELTVVRFGVTNSIIDPWIYILLRKENFKALQRRFRGIFGKITFATDSGDQEVTPSSHSRKKSSDNTLSSGKTLSTDDMFTPGLSKK
ncbi:prostaglandin E2 receptor EP4 subtype-like [Saccostrea echinata]|uniref:prostaglandin E2 receptor EP4 subtype-like n=1 Tax=Saccostrea echinata TaxID=191078 RepID=UPI002A822C84|nr:prostaglandin E2 receptor EP4 subtype-like [Saccostrea echinata]